MSTLTTATLYGTLLKFVETRRFVEESAAGQFLYPSTRPAWRPARWRWRACPIARRTAFMVTSCRREEMAA
ncbi:hypothetical protein [Rugamonas sp. DEMB1]|uniref:hypothetical protein n=1 Tax=Rugamonas sp. DEMB1 TaxID=3039386 RepID=UPI00244CC10D|nr:hypothetical protein [Rugamonas sp. DEMB1]WGG53207.1 hypothetical protein QC826_14505 [Rugamonas sp. DEMB1]